MTYSGSKTGRVLQGYFGRESLRVPALRSAPRVPRPDLLPLKLRGGSTPAQARPALDRTGPWGHAPRPELLPGMRRASVSALVQAQVPSGPGVSATPLPAEQLLRRGAGRPLDAEIRRQMEQFFQADFSGVRVHEGPEPRALGALAFTLGEDLYFSPGLYDPTTRQGVELLGHELTHVVQQRDGRVSNPYGRGVAIVQDPALEAEADRMGQRIANEPWWRIGARRPATWAIQRAAAAAPAAPSVRVFLEGNVDIMDFGTKVGTCAKGDKTQLVRTTIAAGNTVKEFENRYDKNEKSNPLPVKRFSYYTEYRIDSSDLGLHPGPQRLIVGGNGELYYTGDHYTTIVALTYFVTSKKMDLKMDMVGKLTHPAKADLALYKILLS